MVMELWAVQGNPESLIQLTNWGKEEAFDLQVIYIGKNPKGSNPNPLSNPFKMKNGSAKERVLVREAYNEWLKKYVILPGLNGTPFKNYVVEEMEIPASFARDCWKKLLLLVKQVKMGLKPIKLADHLYKPERGIGADQCHGSIIKEALLWLLTSTNKRVIEVVDLELKREAEVRQLTCL